MAENKPPCNNAHCTLPDDPKQSTYRFIIVAAKRTRQLQGGARPVLPTSSKKPTIIAMRCQKPSFNSAHMKVLLAVGGGIAAYKSAELTRLLMQQSHQVQVVMTT